MGLFSWLTGGGGNVTQDDDVVWMTRAARFNGLRQAIATAGDQHPSPDAIVLAAHFPDCLAELEALVNADGLAGSVPVLAVDALPRAASRWPQDSAQTLWILVAERHPLRECDEAIVTFARTLPCRCRIVHHVALDDAVIKSFTGEWLESILKTLGMKEDEPLTSRMVARRIRAAQETLARECRSMIPADSAEDWLAKNRGGTL